MKRRARTHGPGKSKTTQTEKEVSNTLQQKEKKHQTIPPKTPLTQWQRGTKGKGGRTLLKNSKRVNM